ncbi:putative ribonuclease H-like domain-containing protein [Tanacetum coccineum]
MLALLSRAAASISTARPGNPQYTLQDQGIFYSGCSRHMTEKKSFLINYQEIDGEFVAFGGSPKEGKITGKGKIRTGKLDFEDIYFVKELKFNLFSVSQSDKKNIVLFTKTECLVLSPDFKLLDESQVLLKVPRQNNMYSFDLKNVFPRRTPQQNGVAERKNRTLIEAARTMLVDSLLPTTFWAEAVSTAYYVQNRVLVIKPHNKTPYELLHGRPPSISFMRPFGCPVTILNTLDPLGKFDGKADEGFFIGYSINSKAFRGVTDWLFDIAFYYQKSMDYEPVTTESKLNKECSLEDSVADDAGKDYEENSNEGERQWSKRKEGRASNKEDDQNVQDFRAALDNLLVQQKKGYANNTNRDSIVSPSVSTARQRFTNVDNLPADPLMHDLEDTGIFSGAYDDEDVGAEADLNNLETTWMLVLFQAEFTKGPILNDQIIRDINLTTQTRRMTKISKEHAMFARLVDLPKGKHAIGTKWVYRNKKDKRGIVVRNKARLVAQGYTQEEGIDYDEVFVPVARIEAIRLFLAYASFMGFIVYQMDVKSAFLYGTIEKEVYVCQPPGFEDPQFPDKVYKVYVNDIIFGSTKKSLWIEFEVLMHKKFQMSSMGELTFFLGLQVMQRDDGIFISQDKYVADILKKFDFVTVKAASIQLEGGGRDSYEKKLIQVIKIYTDHNVADLLIKAFDVSSDEFGFKTGSCKVNAVRQDLVLLGEMDFLTTSSIHYALTVSPTIYASYIEQFWATPKSKTANDVKQIHATIDGKTVSSGPPKKVDDEAVYTGEGDRVVQATTTASSLEAEQESDVTHLGEQWGEDSMEHQVDLTVLALETSKSAQDLVINKLKNKVKRLEKKQRERTLGMKLFKIGTSRRKSLDKENVSKQGRNLKTRSMFEEGDFDDDFDDTNDMVNEEIENVEGDTVNAGGVVNTATTGVSADSASVTTASASVSTAKPRTHPTTTATAFEDEDLTIAQTLVKMRSEKAKEKEIAFRDMEESARPTRILPTINLKDKGKGITQEPKKPPKNPRKAQI